jgi:uncharacterized protein (DUF433 family)
MSATTTYPHLSVRPDGTVRIGESRYRVLHLAAEHYQHGWTAEELLRQHPDLRRAEVYAALTYFYDHREELVAEMKRSAAVVESARTAQPISPEDLLNRRSSSGS